LLESADVRPAILTTDTLHHAYFVREVARVYPDIIVLEETETLAAPFPTAHPYEQERDAHERAAWFDGRHARTADFADVQAFPSINSAQGIAALTDRKPDAVIVVGTGRLRPEVIDVVPSGRLVNLHGGDPEEYRGLDTHMWAIYHGDFAGLVTTLHMVAPKLDAGDVVAAQPVPLRRGMRIAELRQSNTETALQLSLAALDEFDKSGRIAARPQRRKGRYYSFMPAVLKDTCVAKFNRHCETLP
jgi:methionyl-tRNA formyltransferase